MKKPKLKVYKSRKINLQIPVKFWEQKSAWFSQSEVAPTIEDNVLSLFEQYMWWGPGGKYVYNKVWVTEFHEMIIVLTKYGHKHGFGKQLYFFVKNPETGNYERKIKTNPAAKYYLGESLFEVRYSDYLLECNPEVIREIKLENLI
jgi:hypothetical protein